MKTIAIIGAGASGLMCAISAKRRINELNKSADVILLEKNSRVGKKLLVTGNGKCNIANANEDILAYHSHDIDIAENVLKAFNFTSIKNFFENIGVTFVIKKDGLAYPRSMQASSVLDALRFEAERLGIKVLCDFKADKIKNNGTSYTIYSDKDAIMADALVIAGGSSANGGDGSGLRLLKSFGHKIHTPYPALDAIKCESDALKTAKGMRTDALVSLIIENRVIRTEEGEILFGDYGLSGIAIMQLSGYVSDTFCKNKNSDIRLKLDMAGEYKEDELYDLLKTRRQNMGTATLENFLNGFLNKRIAMALIKHTQIGAFSDFASSLTDDKLKKLSYSLKNFELKVVGVRGEKTAQVMGGGVSLSDFYADTLKSKKSHALFACGEVLDVYGDCGGYNLAWAWASGNVCGKAVADII